METSQSLRQPSSGLDTRMDESTTSVKSPLSPRSPLQSEHNAAETGPRPRLQSTPDVGGDISTSELIGTPLDAGGEEASTAHTADYHSTIEASLGWFRGRVQTMLRLRSDRVEDLVVKNAETKRIFVEFIHEPARRRLLVWPDMDDELHVGFDVPPAGRKKAIYFIKQRDFKVEDNGELSGLMTGDLPAGVLEHLSTLSHEVLYPVLMAGRGKDQIADVFHKFLSQVYLTVGQTQGKTLLPLPPRDPNQKEGADARTVMADKDRIQVLESCVVTWTQQIKTVLRQEPPTFICPGDITTGTMSEFNFWSSRNKDLTCIHEQVRGAVPVAVCVSD